MGVHVASVFLYEEYKHDVSRFVEQVDRENYESLRERTCEAIRGLRQEWPLSDLGWTKYEKGVRKGVLTQEWPLFEHGGGSLLTVDEIQSQATPTSQELGYWFLVVLAEYLQPCPSPSGNWSVLNTALKRLRWRESECDLLFRGLPTSSLLKPKTIEKASWPLKNSDPYWFWLHPGRARSGWLPAEDINRLYDGLCKAEDRIRAFDIHGFPDVDTDNPVVARDYKEYLQSGYQDTRAMLLTARASNQGLFLSITLP